MINKEQEEPRVEEVWRAANGKAKIVAAAEHEEDLNNVKKFNKASTSEFLQHIL